MRSVVSQVAPRGERASSAPIAPGRSKGVLVSAVRGMCRVRYICTFSALLDCALGVYGGRRWTGWSIGRGCPAEKETGRWLGCTLRPSRRMRWAMSAETPRLEWVWPTDRTADRYGTIARTASDGPGAAGIQCKHSPRWWADFPPPTGRRRHCGRCVREDGNKVACAKKRRLQRGAEEEVSLQVLAQAWRGSLLTGKADRRFRCVPGGFGIQSCRHTARCIVIRADFLGVKVSVSWVDSAPTRSCLPPAGGGVDCPPE